MQLFHGSLTHINAHTTGPGERHSWRPGQSCALDFFLSAWTASHARGSSAVSTHRTWRAYGRRLRVFADMRWLLRRQGYSRGEVRVEFRGADFSQRQGLLQSFLYEPQTLVTNFADGAERDL